MSLIHEISPVGPPASEGEQPGNHDSGRVRKCPTTGLPVCLNAQLFIKVNAVMAVVFLLAGATAGLLLALTRWSAVHLLDATWYYRLLTFHGLNMLILWILFMEMAILYFAATAPLNARLGSKTMAGTAFGLMMAGAALLDYTILTGQGDVLMTSYYPLRAAPNFYLGIILVAVGALVGTATFFVTLYQAKRDRTYEGSMPLVTYGAMAAAIIAVCTLLHGAGVIVPTWLWSLGYIKELDAEWYRLVWWGLGHMSQQINVCAMVAVWYLLASLTTGARAINETICRGAFVLYILFINLASAHHLLVDPGVSATWKIWNTSYAMYLAVLASLIHAFTVPASVEVAMRARGFGRGLFGWLMNAPWKDPGFSAFFLSLSIFGFVGGITGVTLGTQQINIIAHNTLRIPGHFHATVVGGTTLAFMGLTYYVVPLIFQREYYFKGLARWQPYIFALGVLLLSFGMSFAGSYGVPRRHWDDDFSNARFAVGFDSGAHFWLGVVGIGGILMFIGALIYILLTVAAVLAGRSNAGKPMSSWQSPMEDRTRDEVLARIAAREPDHTEHKVPGTMALVLMLLTCFIVYYFANWKALADVWHVR